MSVNDEPLGPSSDSFWDIDGYKRTVKRQDEGARLCSDLMTLIGERAEIEKAYAKQLKHWSQKWQQAIEKGPEYGTTQAAWNGVLTEADRMGDIHLNIKTQLLEEVQAKIKQWKTENYHKAMMGVCKETKALDEEFRKAQKPWAKKYSKVKESKKAYWNACKAEKSATNQENNARADTSISADQPRRDPDKQIKKVQDKADKCRKEVEVTKDRYEATLRDLNSYNAKYMEDMTEVFNKSQSSEERRLVFFKEMLFGIHKCIDVSQVNQIGDIYNQLYHTVDQADYQKDLRWWSQHNGIDMGMNWPTFEEYSAELHAISRREKGRSHVGGPEGITMTHHGSTKSNNNKQASQPMAYNNMAANGGQHAPVAAVNSNPSPHLQSQSQNQNPFGDDDWEDDEDENFDGVQGVQVKALYDYVGQEEDELSFKAAEIFHKLKDRDDQGWCTGRKGGRIGLYPDNYAEPI